MAYVYFASRADNEFEQSAALKIIKRGMDTDEIVRRFKHERQTLANLDHPNIAKIIDGGTTDDGLPFFVMEYIDGMPITDYCDKNKLTVDQRLELFIKVCSAVNYAHQNLIVHRDLKPSNILITSDGTPKLLDFGIAKLLDEEQNTNTMAFTREGAKLMTVEYASPEQVKGGKITTASDVYSLGVLLYELLTGHLPYSFKNKFPHEVEKVITLVHPEKPSTIITKSNKTATEDGDTFEISPEEISILRSSNIEKLKRRLSGDIDNIILMALKKDPQRRYSSIQQLAEDIKHYIEGSPVSAHSDSIFYRTSKFVKRHAIGVAAILVINILIVGGVVTVIWQANIASKERDKAELEASKTKHINNFLNEMLSSADPTIAGKDLKIKDILDKASKKIYTELKSQPEIEAEVRSTIGQTYESLGLYEDAIFQHKEALQLRDSLFGENNSETAISYNYVALAYHYKGNLDTAKYFYEKSIKSLRALKDEKNLEEALNNYGTLQMDLYQFDNAKKSFEESLNISLKIFGKESKEAASTMNNLAINYDYQNDLDSAEKYYLQALALDKKLFGDTSIDVSHNLNNLAFIYQERGNYKKAVSLFTSSYEIREKILGENHPEVATGEFNLGCSYYFLKDYDKAEKLISKAIGIWSGKLNDMHYYFGNAYGWLGKVQNAEGKYATAYSNLIRSLQIRKKNYDDKNSLVISTESEIGISLSGQKKYAESEKILLANYNKIKDDKDFDPKTKKGLITALVDLYTKWGKPREASKFSNLISEN